MVEEEWGRERGGVCVRDGLGCARGEVGGRGGDSDLIHIGGIWLENKPFFEGVREVFLWRVSQKQSQTSMRRGTQWMFELTGAETVTGAAGVDMQGTGWGKKVGGKEHCRKGKLV